MLLKFLPLKNSGPVSRSKKLVKILMVKVQIFEFHEYDDDTPFISGKRR